MTLILHGTWLPAEGSFFFWAEAGRHQPRRGRQPELPPHPFQAKVSDVKARLGAGATDAVSHKLTVWLPATRAGPVPSPELLATGAVAAAPDPPTLAGWQATGLRVPVGAALDLLITLTPEQAEAVGADVRAWRMAALLAMELLAGEQVLPALERIPGARPGQKAQWRARWLPRPGPELQARLTALARALPPLCRAATASPEAAPGPRELLDSFIAAAADATIRETPFRPRMPAGTPGSRWLSALVSSSAVLDLDANRADELYRDWQAWAAKAEVAGDDVFRLTFRLEPPDAEGDAWRLAYLLQAADDPSLLVPLQQLWRETGPAFTYLERRFEQPQERVLKALGHAARLSAPIAASLRRPAPAEAALTADQAIAFVQNVSPLLEQSGFGVLVPAWWRGDGTRLQVRAKATPSARAEGPSRLTLRSLVKFQWELTLDGQPISREEFERLAALKQPLVQIRGQWVMLDPTQIEAAVRFLRKPPRETTLDEALRLGLGETPAAVPDALGFAGVEAQGWLAEALQRLAGPATRLEPVPPPAGLHGLLRPYQAHGFAWLAFLQQLGLGACLADDMGLGKTIQTLAMLLHERERLGVTAPALLVCPTSVVGNWQHEIERFAPGLRMLIHRGGGRRRGEAFAGALAHTDVVLTSYPLMARDLNTLGAVEWSTVVLDEAQNIKNAATRQAQAARTLRGRNRIALTGTPVENRLAELWSIMAFLNPGYLGSEAAFRRDFARPIERLGDAKATARLRRLTGPFILRRVKTDPKVIADLPEKLEIKVYCPLTREQATLYEATVREALRAVEATDEDEPAGMQRRGLVLAMLLRLKQICNHPAQYLQDGSPLPGRSGKLARLAEMLEEALAEGDRALVFTQFAQMGHMLRDFLHEALYEEVLFLHGGTPAPERDSMVRRFQATRGPRVLILSLKAGGTGLNLTGANRVFHFDRWWNPAVENQATDRAFRIGQRRNVQVHKFICTGTLEERIDELIESKRALADNVLGAGEGWLTELSTRELRDLVRLRRDAGSVVEAAGPGED